MAAIKLTTPRFRVVTGDPADPDTWTETEVQAIGVDLQMAEAMFKRHGWGAITEQPLKFQALCAWFALRRIGATDDPWEEFEQTYLEVSKADVTITPTPPAPADD